MVASLIQKKVRYYTVAQIMQVVDALVVLAGAYVFGVTKALYAVIAIVVITKVSDMLSEGLHFSKVAYIITEKPDEIAQVVMHDLNRGVTGIPAQGMYTGNRRMILYCVVGKKQIVMLKATNHLESEELPEADTAMRIKQRTHKRFQQYLNSLHLKSNQK